jgi:hypothetical protein
MWKKWVLLATLGGITCLMRGNIGEVVAAPGGAPFILSFLDEVVSVVSAAGEAPKPAFVAATRTTLTTPGSTQAPSMFRDLQQGSPIDQQLEAFELVAVDRSLPAQEGSALVELLFEHVFSDSIPAAGRVGDRVGHRVAIFERPD